LQNLPPLPPPIPTPRQRIITAALIILALIAMFVLAMMVLQLLHTPSDE
jgi:hypothetical protein